MLDVTDAEALRIHPWLPLLRMPDGQIRLHGSETNGAVPHDAAAAVMAAARHVTTTGSMPRTDSGSATDMRILTAAGAVVPRAGLARAAAAGRPIERAFLSRHIRISADPAADDGGGADAEGGADTEGAAAERVVQRTRRPVRLGGPPSLTQELTAALSACGIPLAESPRGDLPALVVHVGRPTATDIHHWMTAGTPHLIVSPRSTSVRVGPLVQPGVTVCLQCLHLARAQRDPMWPWVSERLSHCPIPQPDPVVMVAAAALAVRAVVAFVETGENPLARAYWVADLDDPMPERVPVARHPECGCWWPTLRDAMSDDSAEPGH